jgi:hypothetical protein
MPTPTPILLGRWSRRRCTANTSKMPPWKDQGMTRPKRVLLVTHSNRRGQIFKKSRGEFEDGWTDLDAAGEGHSGGVEKG